MNWIRRGKNPPDAADVLVYTRKGRVTLGVFCKEEEWKPVWGHLPERNLLTGWYYYDDEDRGFVPEYLIDVTKDDRDLVTHWMPLPPPPAQDAEGGSERVNN
ncbi:MAG: hypothetical protein HQL66_03180 [Magnetococcales bacterium]|nr:hypothetical protein [Magnetococcales bacterium]